MPTKKRSFKVLGKADGYHHILWDDKTETKASDQELLALEKSHKRLETNDPWPDSE